MQPNYTIAFNDSISAISPLDWNSLNHQGYPFARFEFLSALEESKVVGKESGWQVKHISVHHNNQLIAAMPMYQKLHSYGEYVFDFQWANAYHQAGLKYYPKWVSAVPFTPSAGPRILVLEGFQDKPELTFQIIKFIKTNMEDSCVHSWHCLFPSEALSKTLNSMQLTQRGGIQFHWFNRQYQNFEQFLASCRKKHRNNIKRERLKVQQQGINCRVIKGDEINPQLMNKFYQYYCRTYLKLSGHSGYLNSVFFQQLLLTMADKLILSVAEKNQQIIGAALFLVGENTLYGRYWGSDKEYEYLHFELCYYQGIDYCIEQQIDRFDAGAQGQHKIQRGFEPVETLSYHYLTPLEFDQAIKAFCAQEATHNRALINELSLKLPYKL
ncbi:GNAT family N-acetyltransferase [Aliikangiella sp. IMCC44632]